MTGWLFELAAVAVIAAYVAGRGGLKDRPAGFFPRFILLVGAAWLGEESCILLYGFYAYSPKWNLFLGQVPLVVILAWPAVILSGRDLASQLMGPGKRLLPLAAAALVGTDAALIEPVAVNAGLWSWQAPGIFGAPFIAFLGWAFFALGCNVLLNGFEGVKISAERALALLIVPPVAAHALILAAWWGALRWVSGPVDPALAVGSAWALSLGLAWTAARKTTLEALEPLILWIRLPAALLIFALLFFGRDGGGLLVLYALAFAPPYMVLLGRRYWGRCTVKSSNNK